MNPLSPMQYLIIAVIAAAIFGAGFTSGFTVQGWRKDAASAAAMSTAVEKYHQLEISVEKQNSGIAIMSYRVEAANEAQARAERNAKFVRDTYATQTTKANNIVVTTCKAMVESLKGVSQ